MIGVKLMASSGFVVEMQLRLELGLEPRLVVAAVVLSILVVPLFSVVSIVLALRSLLVMSIVLVVSFDLVQPA